jgi:hypothetical protein
MRRSWDQMRIGDQDTFPHLLIVSLEAKDGYYYRIISDTEVAHGCLIHCNCIRSRRFHEKKLREKLKFRLSRNRSDK